MENPSLFRTVLKCVFTGCVYSLVYTVLFHLIMSRVVKLPRELTFSEWLPLGAIAFVIIALLALLVRISNEKSKILPWLLSKEDSYVAHISAAFLGVVWYLIWLLLTFFADQANLIPWSPFYDRQS